MRLLAHVGKEFAIGMDRADLRRGNCASAITQPCRWRKEIACQPLPITMSPRVAVDGARHAKADDARGIRRRLAQFAHQPRGLDPPAMATMPAP
jgi:hypothetical protein